MPDPSRNVSLVDDFAVCQFDYAAEFHEAIGLTGIAMTKLDSGARGGILLAIADRLDVPFRFLGIGEQADDMDVFDAEQYVDALLEPHAALGEGSP